MRQMLFASLFLCSLASGAAEKTQFDVDPNLFQVSEAEIHKRDADSRSPEDYVILEFKQCLKNLNNKPLRRDVKFLVGDVNTFIELSTDDSGCVSWSETHHVPTSNPYVPQVYTTQFRRFLVGKDPDYPGFETMHLAAGLRNGRFLLFPLIEEPPALPIDYHPLIFRFDDDLGYFKDDGVF